MKDTLRNMNRAVVIILLLAVLGSLTGCAIHKPFELFDDTTVIKSRTIAVISADGSETTMRLAEALTNELKERSTFKVLSQAKINLRLGKYPVIINEGQPENQDKPVWFGKRNNMKFCSRKVDDKNFRIWRIE